MDPIHQDGGRLMIESVAATDLAARFGTPLYVTSEAALRANVRAWRTALAGAWPHGPTRVLVSLKANPAIALRRILNDEGAGGGVVLAVEDCRATVAELKSRGVEITQEPVDQFYGVDAGFRDPSGNQHRITQRTDGG